MVHAALCSLGRRSVCSMHLKGAQQGQQGVASLHRAEAAHKVAAVRLLAQVQHHQACSHLHTQRLYLAQGRDRYWGIKQAGRLCSEGSVAAQISEAHVDSRQRCVRDSDLASSLPPRPPPG